MVENQLTEQWFKPQWVLPESVFAMISTRIGGVSRPPFQYFNLGLHVGDEPSAVLENRQRLSHLLPPHMRLQWLEQVHGTQVVDAKSDGVTRRGDAVYIDQPGLSGVIMTADCLPVFFVSTSGNRVAIAHAGWRGLAEGVLEKTLARFPDNPADVHVFLGPAIGPCHFEVGEEVRKAFIESASTPNLANAIQEQAFCASVKEDKFLANLYQLALLKLRYAGIVNISGGTLCTYCEPERFFSYRREGQTGRFVSIIGLYP